MSKVLLSLLPSSPATTSVSQIHPNSTILVSRRILISTAFTIPYYSLANISSTSTAVTSSPPPQSSSNPAQPFFSGIANTSSWFKFYGNGFAIRIPPNFQDLTEPEDYDAGLSLYGDKAKPKTFAARFASTDGSEVVSVLVRSSNQLKITFLEAKDVSDLGTLKEAAKIFVPGGSTIYSARAFKIKEDEGYRNYYYYEFGRDDQRVALVAAVISGKAVIAGATAPQNKWDDDGVQLRSAAVSLTLV